MGRTFLLHCIVTKGWSIRCWKKAVKSLKYIKKTAILIYGVILGARVRVFDDTAIGVVVYEVGSTNHMLYMNTAENRIEDKSIVWCTTIPKTDPNASFSITSE